MTLPTGRAAPGRRAPQVTRREPVAESLLRASAEHSFDPQADVDWAAAPVPGLLYLPDRLVSLYGTPLWDRLTPLQRVDLSRHEIASMAGLGIWFETVLLQLLARHVYDLDPTSRHVTYALTEVADECRHSMMFARLIRTLDTPPYTADRSLHLLGRVMKTVSTGPSVFAAVLVVEEILDALQRVVMADEAVQPLARAVCRIHVVEEARHVRYAREELIRRMTRAPRWQRRLSRHSVAGVVAEIVPRLVNPAAYAAVGLSPAAAARVAATSPHRQDVLRRAAARLVRFFDEVGLMGGPSLGGWRRAGLLAPGWRPGDPTHGF